MTTITVDIIDEKALDVLRDLEVKSMIHIQDLQSPSEKTESKLSISAKYGGAMTKQPIDEVNKQLKELRDEWN